MLLVPLNERSGPSRSLLIKWVRGEKRFYPLLGDFSALTPVRLVKTQVGAAEVRNFKFAFGPTWVDDLCFGGRATLYLRTKLSFPDTILVVTVNSNLTIDLWEAEREVRIKDRHYLIEFPSRFLDVNEIDLQLALHLASAKRFLTDGEVLEIAFLPGPKDLWLERFDEEARKLIARPRLIEKK